MYSLYSFVYYAQTPAALGHWSLTCPPEHSEIVIAYLQRQKCKFNRKMQRRAWQKSVIQDRDIFTIEVIPDKAVKALIKATREKGGLVIEPQVVESQIEPLTESIESTNDPQIDISVKHDSFSGDNVLEIKINGGDIPSFGNDIEDNTWWWSQIDLDVKISRLVGIAQKRNPRLVYYPETGRANGNLTRVLKSLGFSESDDCLYCDL